MGLFGGSLGDKVAEAASSMGGDVQQSSTGIGGVLGSIGSGIGSALGGAGKFLFGGTSSGTGSMGSAASAVNTPVGDNSAGTNRNLSSSQFGG